MKRRFALRPLDQIAIGAALLWLLISAGTVHRFPTVFIDEAENANHAYNLAFHHQAVFSLYDNLFPAPLYGLRQAWVVVIRPFFVYPLAWSMRLAGFSWSKARLFNVGVGWLTLLTLYATGCLLQKRTLGLLAMAILGTRFAFLYTSHSIRPEMLLCFAGLLILFLLIQSTRSLSLIWPTAAGFLSGVAGGIHTNGIVFLIPVLFTLALGNSWKRLTGAAGGWIVGMMLFLLSADWDRFLPGLPVLFFHEFNQPPILAHPSHLLLILGQEAGRYVGPWIFNTWRGGALFQRVLWIQALGYAAAVFWGLHQKNGARLVAVFVLALFLSYAFLIGQKAYNYSVILEPGFALAVGYALLEAPAVCRLWGRGLLILCTLATLMFCVSIGAYRPTFDELCHACAAPLRPGAKVAGPQTLWLGLPGFAYRDIGSLIWFRLLLGEKNLVKPLEQFQPDYLILDQTLFTRIDRLNRLRHARGLRGPTGLFPWPHRVLTVVDSGPAYGGMLVVIENDWSSPAARQ